MKRHKLSVTELEKELKHIAETGIQADYRRIKEDMCAQFADPDEWIREYVVNAADAQARTCFVSGFKNEKTITIIVEDDGHGMDKQGVLDFCNIYRSVKRGDPLKIVGCHGVGKLSPAAIQGQCGFVMRTSTGMECWRMEAGCLLENTPIKIERVEPVPPQGTRFEITFEKYGEMQIRSELENLADILETYMCYHPLITVVFEIDGDDPENPKWAKPVRRICGDWAKQTDRFSRMHFFEQAGNSYGVVLELSTKSHEVYQNRVLVTKQYNLLSHDLSQEIDMPHLKIRVDSPDFKMPFGRNCLSNEKVLSLLARYIRQELLPNFFDELCIFYEKGFLNKHNISPIEVEDIACAMVQYVSSNTNSSWCHFPIFAALNYPRLSIAELRRIVGETGILYIENGVNTGMDYSVFDAPVLSDKQRLGDLQLLKNLFEKEIVILGMDDEVLEAPETVRSKLGQREKRFEKFLGFHPEALRRNSEQKKRGYGVAKTTPKKISIEDIQRMSGVCEESRKAKNDLSSLKWRVNYLVERDGKSPCKTHRFLFKNNTVVLNLNYPDVKKLVLLSESAPALASHWALAMCFCDANRILPHLTPEAREDLLLMDAMAKVGLIETGEDMETREYVPEEIRRIREFAREINDFDRWIS